MGSFASRQEDTANEGMPTINDEDIPTSNYTSLWDIPAVTIKHEKIDHLGSLAHDKDCTLVVNVATYWGLTDQHYKQMVQLYKDYSAQGFEIFAWPCN